MSAFMIQGCGSDVGKSLLVAGLCRLFTNRGKVVRPFKPQNMSNNAAVTADGGEIGRAQALQALACRTPPTVDMNPVLLKPQSDVGAQLIVRGVRIGNFEAKAHLADKRELLNIAVESYRRLERECDLMIVEGAGSPAETNLRATDMANMGFAHAVGLPVFLVGDIERGHVIASLVGAHAVLDDADRALIHGFIINKFRGDASLFDAGLKTITDRTGWPSIGVVPYLHAARQLPAEDAVQLDHEVARGRSAPAGKLRIVIPRFPHISNFDDFDPLRLEPDVELMFIPPGRPLPRDTDLIILPGTKATVADLHVLYSQGWDVDIRAHVRHGGRVLGICGGYQMLGTAVNDPDRIEGSRASIAGLGLLDVETTMTQNKALASVSGVDIKTGATVHGYEMHIGVTTGGGTDRPMIRLQDGRHEGAISPDGLISGCHIHGLFNDTAFRAMWISKLGARSANIDYSTSVETALDEIAAILSQSLDLAAFRVGA